MSEERKNVGMGFRATLAIVAVTVVGLPLLYLASLGPLVFLRESGTIGQDPVTKIEYLANLSYVMSEAEPDWFWENFLAYLQWWQSLAN